MEKNKIEEAIKKWRHEFEPIISNGCKKDKFNWAEIFAAIYTFKYVVDIIDNVNEAIAEEKNEKCVLKLPNCNETEIEIVTKKKVAKQKLADQWSKLDDIHLQQNQIKDLQMNIDDVMKLRYANYMGFINRIKLEYGEG